MQAPSTENKQHLPIVKHECECSLDVEEQEVWQRDMEMAAGLASCQVIYCSADLDEEVEEKDLTPEEWWYCNDCLALARERGICSTCFAPVSEDKQCMTLNLLDSDDDDDDFCEEDDDHCCEDC